MRVVNALLLAAALLVPVYTHAQAPEVIDFGVDPDWEGPRDPEPPPPTTPASDTSAPASDVDFDAEVPGTQVIDDDDAYLTNILMKFQTALKGAARNAASGSLLLVIALLSWAVSKSAAQLGLRASIGTILMPLVGSIVYAIAAFHAVELASWFANGLASFCSEVVGGPNDGGILNNPSALMTQAYKLTRSLLTMGMTNSAPDAGVLDKTSNFFGNMLTSALNTPLTIFVAPAILAGFAATAIISIKTVVHSSAKIIVGTTLMPFLVLQITSPLGMMGVGMIAEAAIDLATKSVLVGIGVGILGDVTAGPDADVQSFTQIAVAVWAVALVCADMKSAIGFGMQARRLL